VKYSNAKGQRLQDDLIAALLAHKKVSEIAKMLGVTENSIRNWMQDATFKEKYESAKKETFGKAMDAVQSRLEQGVNAMWTLVLDPEASATARVAGFRILLEAAWRAKDLTELEERLTKLEGRAA
jgi:predicted transcriptional regulator